jgi:hypothetical protein
MKWSQNLYRISSLDDAALDCLGKNASTTCELFLQAVPNFIHPATWCTCFRDLEDSRTSELESLSAFEIHKSDSFGRDVFFQQTRAQLEIVECLLLDEENLTRAYGNRMSVTPKAQALDNFCTFHGHHRFAITDTDLEREDRTLLILHLIMQPAQQSV